MSPADALTAVRAILALPIGLLVLRADRDSLTLALGLFVAAALTDAADGVLARRGGATARGALLDQLADKVLVLAVLGAITAQGAAPPWALAVVAARELAVSWLRRNGEGPPVGVPGKIKAALQDLALCALLAAMLIPELAPAAGALLLCAVAATALSGAGYLVRAQRVEA